MKPGYFIDIIVSIRISESHTGTYGEDSSELGPQELVSEDLQAMPESSEPIYLTKNGRDDTVIMSVEAYEEMAKYALFYKLEEGIRQAEDGGYLEKDEAIKEIRKSLGL